MQIRENGKDSPGIEPALPRCKIYTQRNLFQVLLNQTEIRLYLPFSDWFGAKRTSVRIQINRKMVNTIWFQVNLLNFKKISLCVPTHECLTRRSIYAFLFPFTIIFFHLLLFISIYYYLFPFIITYFHIIVPFIWPNVPFLIRLCICMDMHNCITHQCSALDWPLATIVTSFSFAVRETASLGIMGALRCPP